MKGKTIRGKLWRGLHVMLALMSAMVTSCELLPDGDPLQAPDTQWALAWSDEFDGETLDSSVWNYDLGAGGWGNNELQFYRKENAVLSGGYLTITAKRESYNGSLYTSSRLQTSRKKEFTYGRFQIRAKLPKGQGLWPAFWLLGASSASFNLYGGDVPWPACGEIDAMEMIGGQADGKGDFTVHGTLHYKDQHGINPMPSYNYIHPSRLSEDFHIYEVEWLPTGFSWKIDGTTYGSKTMKPDMEEFTKPFFLILNLAVGGNWGGYPDASSEFPQDYVIDYVRVYRAVDL